MRIAPISNNNLTNSISNSEQTGPCFQRRGGKIDKSVTNYLESVITYDGYGKKNARTMRKEVRRGLKEFISHFDKYTKLEMVTSGDSSKIKNLILTKRLSDGSLLGAEVLANDLPNNDKRAYNFSGLISDLKPLLKDYAWSLIMQLGVFVCEQKCRMIGRKFHKGSEVIGTVPWGEEVLEDYSERTNNLNKLQKKIYAENRHIVHMQKIYI